MTAPTPTSDVYWCSLDQDDFAKAYFSRASQQGGLNGFSTLTSLQRLANRHYYGALPINFIGEMPSSAMATRSGEQGENIEVRVNQFHVHINAKHQIIVAPKLAWHCQATNTDSKSLADSERGSAILEYLWKSGPYELAAINAEKRALLEGEFFLVTLWDPQAGKMTRVAGPDGQPVQPGQTQPNGEPVGGTPQYQGDVALYAVPSWDVLRQQSAKSFAASPWVSARIPRNRFELIAQFPDMADEIRKLPAATTNSGDQTSLQTNSDPDTVVAHYFFHKKTPALPLGLQAILCSPECVLEFDALETCYQHSPVHRFPAMELSGTPYGYTSCWEAMGIQDLLTDVESSLATNIVTFAKQLIVTESGTDIIPSQLGNGPNMLNIPKGAPEPKALQLYAANSEMFQTPARLTSDIRSTMGLNDMAMGQPPQGPPNAQAWALLATANITNNSQEQRYFIDGVRSVGRSLLEIIKAKMDQPRKVAIVGKFGAQVAKQDEFDRKDFSGIEDVSIEIDNPLMQTAAGRLPIAQMFLDAGFVKVPEQLETLVSTGKLEAITQVFRNEMNLIAAENEQLLAGQNPPTYISDSHQLHLREHKDSTFLPDARGNVAAINAYNAHIKQHIDLLMGTDPRVLDALGQAAPPPPAAPPMGPPPPGGNGKAAKQASNALAQPGSPAQGEASKIPIPSAPDTGQPVNPGG